MNKDNIEGGLRKTAGQIEETAGRAIKNKQMTGELRPGRRCCPERKWTG